MHGGALEQSAAALNDVQVAEVDRVERPAEDADAHRRRARIDALAVELVGDGEEVRWRHRDEVGGEVR